MFEVISDFLNALGEILVGGIRIQTKPTGNLCNSLIFVETEMENATLWFFQLLVHESRNIVNLFLLFVNGLLINFGFNRQ